MTDMTCAEFKTLAMARAMREAVATRVAYIPQEYPKMVPGPNGPTTVQNQDEEIKVLMARLGSLAPAKMPRVEPINVAAWIAARNAPQHDWIAALHRPYVPVV